MTPQRMSETGLLDWINGDVDHANLQVTAQRHDALQTIFHLAGGSHVGRSFQNPAEDFQRTVVAASQLFEWARQNSPQTPIVVVSSAAVYGAGHEGQIGEDSVLNPFSPYGANKAILESLARSYCNNFGLKIAICRLFSVYGEGLEKQLIFDLCRKCSQAEGSIQLGGTGNELRDWIHVSDVARLLWMLPDQCTPDCFTVNGASGQATTVRQVAEHVVKAWDLTLPIEFNGQSRPGDPVSLVAEVSRAKSLGFQPEIDMPTGFQRVADWFRSNQNQQG